MGRRMGGIKMEEYIEVSAKTKEEAIMNAAIQLGTSSDNIEYDVIQEATSGLFGIGRKPAIIRARKKKDISLDFEEAVRDPLKDISAKKSFMKKPAKKFTKEPVKKQPEKTVEKKEEKEPQAKPAVTREKLPINKEAAEKDAKEFLEKMFAAMDSEVCIKTSFDKDDNLNIELSGKDMGVLIGKRGQTLDSIQYLTSLVVNKGNAGYVRVKVDTENYRARRKETLENLAKNIAFKVKRTKKPVFLEPMNPYERRVIHSALQNDPLVSTHSEGEEPYRKVVVTLKKQ